MTDPLWEINNLAVSLAIVVAEICAALQDSRIVTDRNPSGTGGLELNEARMLWFTHFAVWVAISVVTAELLGYLLHRLLHSGWIPWLSKGHMEHHMVLYGPLQKQRPTEKYQDATKARVALGNIGLEWIAPSAVILTIVLTVLRALGVSRPDRAICVATILAWSFLMFSYLHDRLHVKNFWMERNPVLKLWFRDARRLHDIHHRVLNDRGLMDRNFGIGFFLFDRLLGTFSPQQTRFNRSGYQVAKQKFKHLETPRESGECVK